MVETTCLKVFRSLIPLVVLFVVPLGALRAEGPDLSNMMPILNERFVEPLQRYDGRQGLWSTLPRRRQLVTNGSSSGFWDKGVFAPHAEAELVDTIETTSEGLALRTVHVPKSLRSELDAYLKKTRQGDFSNQIRYFVGQINTHETWAQRYGYFEITARIPIGKGRWPAFWLTDAGPGWPPELDIFEAYGKGLVRPTDHDNIFHAALHFEQRNEDGKLVSGDVRNPFVKIDGTPQAPNFLEDYKGGHHAFQRVIDAQKDLGADIYGRFNTYAAHWTPETVTYYFGPDPDTLKPIYKIPTPPGAHTPMYLIANDQFTTQGHWWEPDPAELDRVVTPENALLIRQIKVQALRPTVEIGVDQPDPGSSVISGTTGSDWIEPGIGFDIVNPGGGADTLFLERGIDGKVINGFDAKDELVLVGYPFESPDDAFSRLTQVGRDVWLPSGADPANPQTLIFRDRQIGEFRPAQFRTIWPIARKNWAADAALDGEHIKYSGDGKPVLALHSGSKISDAGMRATLVGGSGPDHYYVAHADTVITERFASGIDTLTTYVSYRLPDHVEHGIAEGSGAFLAGNDRDNRLHAAASNVTLAGGLGDDLYVIEPGAEAVIQIEKGRGHDRLVGLKSGDSVGFARQLSANQKQWQSEKRPNGLRIWFSDAQSLMIVGDPEELNRRFPMAERVVKQE